MLGQVTVNYPDISDWHGFKHSNKIHKIYKTCHQRQPLPSLICYGSLEEGQIQLKWKQKCANQVAILMLGELSWVYSVLSVVTCGTEKWAQFSSQVV